jgi:hypothetical protein
MPDPSDPGFKTSWCEEEDSARDSAPPPPRTTWRLVLTVSGTIDSLYGPQHPFTDRVVGILPEEFMDEQAAYEAPRLTHVDAMHFLEKNGPPDLHAQIQALQMEGSRPHLRMYVHVVRTMRDPQGHLFVEFFHAMNLPSDRHGHFQKDPNAPASLIGSNRYEALRPEPH